jgi:hypothetical protein
MGILSDCHIRVRPSDCILFVRCARPSTKLPTYSSFSSPIPEITDADMAFQAAETHASADDKPFRKQYKLFHAAFAQFCYTGAQ